MTNEPACAYCGLTASAIEEYRECAEDAAMTPAEFVRTEEGTYNPDTNHFACTSCYIEIGMPSRPYPQTWRAP